MLKQGINAPEIILPDQNGNMINLKDFLGQKVVLYFYSKDNTGGCTKQALGFKDAYNEFAKKKIKIIGISKDSVLSHKKFTDKYELPFTLLADTDLIAIKAYDVWHEKKLYGKVNMGVVRTAYVINEEGIIEKVFEKVKPDVNAYQILDYVSN